MRREQRQLQTNPIHQKSPARRAFHDCGEDGPLSKVPARMALKGAESSSAMLEPASGRQNVKG